MQRYFKIEIKVNSLNFFFYFLLGSVSNIGVEKLEFLA